MRLRSARVTNFGTIDGPLELQFRDGLTVIYGENEAGKSTLMRAIWYAFTQRSTTSAQDVKAMIPQTGGTPEVTVVFDIDGDTYTLTKVFGGSSGGRTHLEIQKESGAIDNYTGDEADEVLRDALGFGEASGRAKTPSHTGFWPITWVEQGKCSIDPSEVLVKNGDATTLSQVLAEVSGEVLAGIDGADVVERAYEEYRKYYTLSGNESRSADAPLYNARQRYEEAKKEHEALKELRDNYDSAIAAYISCNEDVRRLEKRLPEFSEQLEEAKEELAQVETLRGEKETAEARLESAAAAVVQIEERIENRSSLKKKKEEWKGERQDAIETIDEVDELLKQNAEKRTTFAREAKEAEETYGAAKKRVQLLQAHQDVLRRGADLERLEAQLAELQRLEKELQDVKKKLAAISVDDERLEEFDELNEDLRKAEAKLEVASAHLRLKAHEDVEISIGEEDYSLEEADEQEKRIDRETTLVVGTSLSIEVMPGGEDLAATRQEVEELRDQLRTELEEVGVDTVVEAHAENRRRETLLSRKEQLEADIKKIAPDGAQALKDAQTTLKGRLEQATARREKYESEEGGSLPDTEDEVIDELTVAKDHLEEAEGDRDAKKERLRGHEESEREARSEKSLAEQAKKSADEQIEGLDEELRKHVELHGTDKELKEELTTAQALQETKKGDVAEIEATLAELKPDIIESNVQRLAGVVKTTKEELRDKENEASRLEGRLSGSELLGLHDRLAKAEHKLSEARDDLARWERRAAAAKLLYETLEACKKEAREAYLAPLRDEVKRLTSRFAAFEDGYVEFGEEFEVSSFSRPGNGDFPFDQLSGGAKEQLGLLIRLAMARLVANERCHPLFLDEILAETDDDRFVAMATMLRDIARDLQVIVTTCHKERFRQVGVPITDLNGQVN